MKKVVLLACALLTTAVSAQPTSADLKRVEQQLKSARALEQEHERKANEVSADMQSVRRQMVQAAKNIQEKEQQLSDLDKQQAALVTRQKELEKKLALTQKQLVKLTTGMQTLAIRPASFLWIQPQAPVDNLRSRLLMQYSLPVIGKTTDQTRQDLAELTVIRNELANKISQARTTTAQLEERSIQMEKLLQQKAVLQHQYQASYDQAKKRATQLANQAGDLKDLLSQLEAERRKKEEERQQQARLRQQPAHPTSAVPKDAFERSFGALPLPVRGQAAQNFGDITPSGAHVKGMTLMTRPRAQVIAPFDGTVLFSGPFQSYGQLLILDCGGGYVVLLAGMETINAAVGQELLTGEPIGTTRAANAHLYIEIRKDGQAIDPKGWFVL